MSSALTVRPASIVTPNVPPNVLIPARIDLTAAKIAAANSTPVTLLPALTGYTYVVTQCILIKNSVTAFTGAQAARLSYGNSSLSTTGIIFDAGLFSAATTTAEITVGVGSARYLAAGDGAATDVGGTSIKFNVLVGDMAAGSDMTFVLTYMIFPITSANAGSY